MCTIKILEFFIFFTIHLGTVKSEIKFVRSDDANCMNSCQDMLPTLQCTLNTNLSVVENANERYGTPTISSDTRVDFTDIFVETNQGCVPYVDLSISLPLNVYPDAVTILVVGLSGDQANYKDGMLVNFTAAPNTSESLNLPCFGDFIGDHSYAFSTRTLLPEGSAYIHSFVYTAPKLRFGIQDPNICEVEPETTTTATTTSTTTTTPTAAPAIKTTNEPDPLLPLYIILGVVFGLIVVVSPILVYIVRKCGSANTLDIAKELSRHPIDTVSSIMVPEQHSNQTASELCPHCTDNTYKPSYQPSYVPTCVTCSEHPWTIDETKNDSGFNDAECSITC